MSLSIPIAISTVPCHNIDPYTNILNTRLLEKLRGIIPVIYFEYNGLKWLKQYYALNLMKLGLKR